MVVNVIWNDNIFGWVCKRMNWAGSIFCSLVKKKRKEGLSMKGAAFNTSQVSYPRDNAIRGAQPTAACIERKTLGNNESMYMIGLRPIEDVSCN